MPLRTRPVLQAALLLVGMALLSACTEARLAVYGAKQIMGPDSGDTRPYKVGSPYQMAGVWYYPKEDPNYDQVGTASWYGPKFHGSLTANGETYDMNGMTAAHPTLPMPSWVRVTNLENGRSVVLRINDRGPYKKNRLIDLSRAAAKELNIIGKGTAHVRVTMVRTGGPDGRIVRPQWLESAAGHAQMPDPQQALIEDKPRAAPSADVAVLPVEQTATSHPAVTGQPALADYYIQIGAFTSFESAQTLRTRMTQMFGAASVNTTMQQNRTLHKVWVGPYRSPTEAATALASLRDTGYAGAHIVQPEAAPTSSSQSPPSASFAATP